MTDDERERLTIEARRMQYHEYQESKRAAHQLQSEYGRWLVASLLLIHGAAILLPAQNPELMKTVIQATFVWNVTGLLLALACGFAAWVNWTYNAQVYRNVTPGMIVGVEHWPSFDGNMLKKIVRTYRLSVVFGLASVACIVAAAVAAHCTME